MLVPHTAFSFPIMRHTFPRQAVADGLAAPFLPTRLPGFPMKEKKQLKFAMLILTYQR